MSSGNHFIFSVRTNANNWILNTRGTNHICYSLELFATYTQIPAARLRSTNGNQTHANIAGSDYISNNLVLHGVLYLPTFTFNLISVTKLTSSSNCYLIFTNKACEIQDLATLRIIRSAKVEVGLYVLQGLRTTYLPIASVNTIPASELDIQHCRLRHLSKNKNPLPNKLYLTSLLYLVRYHAWFVLL